MPGPQAPRHLAITADCTDQCSINEKTLPAGISAMIHSALESGVAAQNVADMANAAGANITARSLQRHVKAHVTVGKKDHEANPADTMTLDEMRLAIARAGMKDILAGRARVSASDTLSAVNALIAQDKENQPWLGFLASFGEDEEDDEEEPEPHPLSTEGRRRAAEQAREQLLAEDRQPAPIPVWMTKAASVDPAGEEDPE